MTTTTPVARPEGLAASDLGNLPEMLRASDSPEDAHYLDLLRIAIAAYRHALKEPDPRAKDLAGEAREIERLSAELSRRVAALASGLNIPPEFPHFGTTAFDFIESAPEIAGDLAALSAAAGRVRRDILAELGSGVAASLDKGGRGGVRSRRLGTPRRRFVADLATVFAHFIGAPGATLEGPFYRFCAEAHLVATGGDAKGLERDVRAAALALRRRSAAFDEALARASDLRRQARAERDPQRARDLHEEASAVSEQAFNWRND